MTASCSWITNEDHSARMYVPTTGFGTGMEQLIEGHWMHWMTVILSDPCAPEPRLSTRLRDELLVVDTGSKITELNQVTCGFNYVPIR